MAFIGYKMHRTGGTDVGGRYINYKKGEIVTDVEEGDLDHLPDGFATKVYSGDGAPKRATYETASVSASEIETRPAEPEAIGDKESPKRARRPRRSTKTSKE